MPTDANNLSLGHIGPLLKRHPITTSAPCRIDFGGTLDISSFHYPLRHLAPATVNFALDCRTTVRLASNEDDHICVSSAGFADAAFAPATAPYDHPLGLMFAVADYFAVSGVHIHIDSTSPPRSGLGGSSVAAVALVTAFSKVGLQLGKKAIPPSQIAHLAHAIEQGVAGVPCGIQDQLAAVFGGAHAWSWPARPDQPPFTGHRLLKDDALERLDRHLLVAYLGVTHVSSDINGTWIRRFIHGRDRDHWHEIVGLTHVFADAIRRWDLPAAANAMNRETAIRKAMTPPVLDEMGDDLATAAIQVECGARFTGAGGGGCLWAMGPADAVAALKPIWQGLLDRRSTAGLIDCRIDPRGVL